MQNTWFILKIRDPPRSEASHRGPSSASLSLLHRVSDLHTHTYLLGHMVEDVTVKPVAVVCSANYLKMLLLAALTSLSKAEIHVQGVVSSGKLKISLDVSFQEIAGLGHPVFSQFSYSRE